MEAKDLMIGDLVRVNRDVCIKNDTIVRVCGIDATNKLVEKGLEGSATCVPVDDIDFYSGGIWVKYLSPIPLTPEILEKNGWSHRKLHGSYGRKGMRIDGPPYEELPDGIKNALDFAQWSIDEEFQYHLLEIYMWRGDIRLWVNYVHELQRALRCCELNELANNFKV